MRRIILLESSDDDLPNLSTGTWGYDWSPTSTGCSADEESDENECDESCAERPMPHREGESMGEGGGILQEARDQDRGSMGIRGEDEARPKKRPRRTDRSGSIGKEHERDRSSGPVRIRPVLQGTGAAAAGAAQTSDDREEMRPTMGEDGNGENSNGIRRMASGGHIQRI